MTEVQTMVGFYPADGPIEEMRGMRMEIPTSVTNKREWMESKWREEVAQLAAQEEKKAREAKVLQDRIQQQQKASSVSAQLEPLRDELEEVQQRVAAIGGLLEEPDTKQFVEINASTTDNMARTMEMSGVVNGLLTQVEGLSDSVRTIYDRALELQDQTLQVNKNRLEMSNQAMEGMSAQISQRDEMLETERLHSRQLMEDINANYQVVMAAKDVKASTVEAARTAVNAEINELSEDFVEMINLVLMSLGLSQRDLQTNLNQVDVSNGRDGVRLTRRQISQFADVYRKATAAIRKEELDA